MNAVVTARNLFKRFGKSTALDDVSFTIAQGSITGLVGPNGAGKTTTLRALLGLTSFEGELDVLGMDPRKGRHHLMERVCFIADVGVLPRWMQVADALEFVAGVHPRFNRAKAEGMLSATKIGKHHKVRELSKGMITQLHLALILAIEVELLVLDEPTLGLDILYQRTFFEQLLNNYYDQSTTIIISTHQVDEVKSLLTHLMFIDAGKLVLNTTMEAFGQTWCEVKVAPGQYTAAAALKPIHERQALGGKVMLFEGVARELLESLGELQTPSVSDLFVAKLQRH